MSAANITRICLIRHGETDWNLQHRYQGQVDIPLNALGRRQAALLAESMQAESWDVIVSSPLSRALDTARAVAGAVGLGGTDIATDPRLVERAYGKAEGLTLAEREATWPGGNWPGLEEWEHVSVRAMTALTELAEAHRGKRILVVCHGGLINAVLATLTEGELGTGKTVIDNTSRTTLDVRGDAWEIVAVNEVDHLEELAVAD